MSKQEQYRIRQVLRREHWYCDVGPTKEQWRAMSADQQAVFKRWKAWYERRRAMREMCRGGP